MTPSSGLIFLAAGSSKRFGGQLPKQFLSLNGEPLFMRSLRVFGGVSSIRSIIFVTQPKNFSYVKRWVSRLPAKSKVTLVKGGTYRGESVRNGMSALPSGLKVVLVHDAAR